MFPYIGYYVSAKFRRQKILDSVRLLKDVILKLGKIFECLDILHLQ